MYNIRGSNRSDFMLGCSVDSYAVAQKYLTSYQQRYPQWRYSIVITDYPGDMAGVTVDHVLEYMRTNKED